MVPDSRGISLIEGKTAAEFFNIVGSIVVILDTDGNIAFLNKKGYQTLGYREGELSGKNWFDTCIPKENRKDVKNVFGKCAGGKIKAVEYHENLVVTKSGERRMVSWHNTPIKNNSGKIIGGISSGDDITERKRAQEDLEKSKEVYKTIFENLPFAAFTLDKNGKFLEANKYAAQLTGFKIKDLVGKRFSEIGALEKRDLLKAFLEFRKNLHGKVTEKTVYNVKLKDGREILFELVGIPLKDNGKVTKVLDVGNDITERKKAEEDLKKSEEKYRFLVDNIDEIVLIISKTGKILFVNNKAMKTFGYSAEEVIGKSILSFLTKNSIRKTMYALAQEFLGRHQPEMEIEIKIKTGEVRTLSVAPSSIPVYDKGKMIGIQVNCTDVTERRKAAQSIKESEEKYRNIIETAPEGIITAGLDGRINSCNSAFLKLTGYPKEDIVGKNFSKLPTLRSRDAPKYIKLFASLMRGKTPSEPPEITWIKKDGTSCSGEISFSLLKEGGRMTGMQAFVRDTTERRRSEEEVRRSEDRFRMIFEHAPDAYYLNDMKGTFIDGNFEAERITGYRRDELIGKSFTKLNMLKKGQLQKAISLLVKNAAGMSTGPDEFKLVRKDGKEVPVEISTHPVKIGGRTLTLGIARDISERKKTEEDLKKSKEDLELKVKDLETFNKASVGRELKMVELKNRIKELERRKG